MQSGSWVAISIGSELESRMSSKRFAVDSSYWVYLVHLPVAIFVVGVFAPWNAAGIVKMCVAIAVTAALSFASYAAARAVLPRRA